jgi:hypothetical protein
LSSFELPANSNLRSFVRVNDRERSRLRVLESESESTPGFQGGKLSSVERLSTDKQMVKGSITVLGLHPKLVPWKHSKVIGGVSVEI